MEKQTDFNALEEAKEIRAMLRILPLDIGPISINDLREIYSQLDK